MAPPELFSSNNSHPIKRFEDEKSKLEENEEYSELELHIPPISDKVEEINFNIPEKFKEIVKQPFNYVYSMKSKNLREKIARSFNYWYKIEESKFQTLLEIVNFLHNASLIIDDIEDGSNLRRCLPAAHVIHGLPQSLNSANYIYFDVMRKLLEEDEPTHIRLRMVTQFVEGMLLMHVAQGLELFWRDANIKAKDDHEALANVPTEEDFVNIVVNKTTGQFLLLAKALQEKSNHFVDVQRFAKLLGLHFQIRDDLLNLTSNTYEATKGFCEDITEGKFSFPIIYALQRRHKGIGESGAIRLLQILRMQTHDRELKKEALEIIKSSGALEYSRKKLQIIYVEIYKEMLRLGGNPVFMELKEVFSDTF